MAGVPGFQEIERAAVAHLADADPIRAQAQGVAHQPPHIDPRIGSQGNAAWQMDVQFRDILNTTSRSPG